MSRLYTARLFRNGRNRAVRIPRELDIFGSEVTMHKEDGQLILTSRPPRRSMAEVMAGWVEIKDEFLDTEDRLPEPFDILD